jgi:hypothetical protein
LFIAAGVAMLVFGFVRLANGQTGRAVFAFGGVLLDCVLIGFLVWLICRAKVQPYRPAVGAWLPTG